MASISALEYERDFYGWIHQNIDLLKRGKLADIDVDILIDELESMAKRDKRELTSRLMILIAHLLKWQFQPENQSGSWRSTIREQRIQLLEQLEESPSLRNSLDESVVKAYPKALALAVDETGLSSKNFPSECPYTLKQLLDENFYPR
jgi:hypothetical protein